MQPASSRPVSRGPSGATGRLTAAPASTRASASGLACSRAGTGIPSGSLDADSQRAASAARASSSSPVHVCVVVITAGAVVACAALTMDTQSADTRFVIVPAPFGSVPELAQQPFVMTGRVA